MKMHAGAHHFAHVHLCRYAALAYYHMLRPYAHGDLLLRNVLCDKALLLILAQFNAQPVRFDEVAAVALNKAAIEEVHLRRAYKACHEQIGGMVKHLLRRTYLLDKSILHYNYPVAQRHGLGLVVGNIYKRGIYPLPQLYQLRAHLVPQLRVKV